MIITRRSLVSGLTNSLDINITHQELQRVEEGNELIQRILPYLDAPEREFIKTGITPEEWTDIFGES